MNSGERSGEPGRSAHTSKSNNKTSSSSFVALFRNVLRSPFTQDARNDSGSFSDPNSGTTATTGATATAYLSPAAHSVSHMASMLGDQQKQQQQQHQQQQQQHVPEGSHPTAGRTNSYTASSMAESVGSCANMASFDAASIAHDYADLLDKDVPLTGRLDALERLALELRDKKLSNISELWRLLGDIVQHAFYSTDNIELAQEPDQDLVSRARILVLALLVSIAKGEQTNSDFGGNAQQTRREMLDVLGKADGWVETTLAVQSAAWASDNAQCFASDAAAWFERARGWAKMSALECYSESPAREPLYGSPDGAQEALTASLAFLSAIVATEYPVLDPEAVSVMVSSLCDQATQPRLVVENGIEEVTWVWTEAEHLYGVLRLLKTVITYGALSQSVLMPGIMLLCTTVNITICKELCCDIVHTLFTSCYMRDTLLSMNYILRRGNTSLNAKHIYGVSSLTPHQSAVNGMVYYITQVMDTGPTGFQFSLRTGNCLPVLHKAAQCMHPDVLRLVFPYLCKIVNDDRVDSMKPDDWAVLIAVLKDTVDCRLTDKYEDADSTTDEGSEIPTLAYLYDCALQSIVGFFRRCQSPTPALLVELLYKIRAALDDELAQSLLQLIDARGSLRPGSSNWLETLGEIMHLYYFDRARSISLRRYTIQLCGKVFTEAVDLQSSEIQRVPIVMSVFEQLRFEEDEKVVGCILKMLGVTLKKAIDPYLFEKVLEASERAATEPAYHRLTSTSQQQKQSSAPHSTGETSPTHRSITSQQSGAQLPVLVENDSAVKEERLYSSYFRVSLTIKCLLGALEARVSTSDSFSETSYMQWAADTIKLTNLLLDLLESVHTFPSMQREILAMLFRLHSDASLKLYILNPDRDSLMDQRVSLNENARLKLWDSKKASAIGANASDAGSDDDSESSGAASPVANPSDAAVANAIAAVRRNGVPFPIARYVNILLMLFKTNTDIETYYVLCEGLTRQLGNTYLFSAYEEETEELVLYLVNYLRTGICAQETRSRMPLSEKSKIQTLAYELMISIMHYKAFLLREEQDRLISAFCDGLIVASGSTVSPQICLHALRVGMLELPAAMMRMLSSTLLQLAKIYSTAHLSVDLIEFVASMSREQKLYANLRPSDYRMLFAVSINYIRFHNTQRRREASFSTGPGIVGPIESSSNSAMSSRASSSHRRPSSSTAPAVASAAIAVAGNIVASRSSVMDDPVLSQYVLVMAYQVINVYYLSLNPGLKAEIVDHLILGLLQSNYSRDSLDESNEVCLDMILHNYNKTSEDVLGQVDVAIKEDFGPVVERSWLQHNGIVTIRAQKEGPLAQILIRSPSGSFSRVVDLPAEVAKKHTERAELLPTSPLVSPIIESPTSTIAALAPSPPGSTVTLRGRSISRKRRLHSLVISGPSGPSTETDMFPADSICRLLRGELVLQGGKMRAARLPIKFGPAPCLAQEFITAYEGLQNIDPPIMLPTQLEAIARSIRVFDSTSTIDMYKVSVAYVGPGQTTEDEILLNQQGSPAYWNFLRGLGNITRLSDMKGFSAGLDTSGQDIDGRYAITWRDLIGKLVFHVGTLMPAQEGRQEQILRKKAHMGNDYVHIVFNESGKDYDFDTIHTQFNFVQIIVTPVDGQTPAPEEGGSWLQSESDKKLTKFEQLYKVKTQVNPDLPFAGPAMEPKLLSLTALPSFVRSVAIHAAIFSQVFSSSSVVDMRASEFISPWRARLQTIKRIRVHLQKDSAKRAMEIAQQQQQQQQQQSHTSGSGNGSSSGLPPLKFEADLSEFGEIVSEPLQAKTASQALGCLIKDLETFYGRM
ncbi:Tuberous sclerosis 2-like protein [Coemansia umbellata]|uniref:Tuberous sclerosis 2-like protein n=1 Tax=Coemansia umbellata TaxID=1424467 RepID=A0ABQ8PSX2_9FUNG|nr:Tuberous sclerosis 2-like protein [Coemansia umbellata]